MQIFGIKLDKLKYKELIDILIKFDKQNIVFTPNPEILLKTKKDEEFKKLLEKANYLTPDGIGLYIAFQILDNNYGKIINTFLIPYYFINLFFRRKYLYKKYGDRICGSDLTKDMINIASESQIPVTIIDLYNPTDVNKIKSQEIFKELLTNKFPKLKFDYFVYNPIEKENIINQIGKSESKILFSTLGMKKQEESVIEIMEKCSNIKLGLGIGSSFDYFIGFQKRAPKIWRAIGLEWLYRLITGPRKIDRLKRLYNAIFVFIYEVVINKNKSRNK
ncbi:MAG: WecB/TagA/CpsF family glycosyltransferase [Candidatus Gracilibacteria bacterium]|nr:WecB/TagA/CpsF family glycosyltransferase [Candidatus Gracilibacteria bacterium]